MSSKRSKGKRRPALPGCGLGAHQEASAMARGTVTRGKRETREREDRRKRQRGWE